MFATSTPELSDRPLAVHCRVAVIDDEPERVQAPLEAALKALGVPAAIENYGSVPEAAAKLPRFRADLMLHDYGGVWDEVTTDRHDPISGAAGLWALRLLFPEIRSMVVSRLDDVRAVATAVELGARGYHQIDDIRIQGSSGSGNEGAISLAHGIATVISGGASFSPRAARALEELEAVGSVPQPRLPLTVIERFDRDHTEAEARELLDVILKTGGDLKALLAHALSDSSNHWRPRLQGDKAFKFIAGVSNEYALYAAIGSADLPLAKDVPPEQREVAERVLQGLTQAQIAKELFIGTRTVEDRLRKLSERVHEDAPNEMQIGGRDKSMVAAQVLAGYRGAPIVTDVKVVTLSRPIARDPATLVA
jgi:DNA-binding NarL/FixJ family response regulator